MLAVLSTNAPGMNGFDQQTKIAFGITILCIAGSLIYWYKATFPQLDGGQHSVVYFKEIAQRTEQKFIDEYKKQTEEEWMHDVLGQAWRNSQILDAKYKALKVSLILLSVALIPWVTALAMIAIKTPDGVSLLK